MASNNFTYTQTTLSSSSYRLSVLPTGENWDYGDLVTSGTVTDGLTSKYFQLVHWGVPELRITGSSPHKPATGGTVMYTVHTHYPFVFRSVPDWIHISDNYGHQIQEGQTIPPSSAETNGFYNTYFMAVDPNSGHTRDSGTFNMGHYIGTNRDILSTRVVYFHIEQDAGSGVTEYIRFNPSAITFGATAHTNDTKQVVVSSSSRWNGNLVLYDTNKFSISPIDGGSGDTTVTITYLGESNVSASYRTMLNIYAIDGTSGMWITKAALRNPVEYNPINTSLTYNGGMIEFDVTVSNLAEYILSQTPGVTVGDTFVKIYFSPGDWLWRAYTSGCTFYLNDVPSPVNDPPTTSDGFYTSSHGAVELKLHEGTYNIKFTVPSFISDEEMDRWSYYPGTIGYSIFYQGGYYRFNSPNDDLYCYIFEDEEPVPVDYIAINPTGATYTSAYTENGHLTVSASTSWRIVSKPNWASFKDSQAVYAHPITSGTSGFTDLWVDIDENTGSSRSHSVAFALNDTSITGYYNISQAAGSLPDPEGGVLHIYPEDDITDITSMGGVYSVLFENDEMDAENWDISYSDDWMQFYSDTQATNYPVDIIYDGQTVYLFLRVNGTSYPRTGVITFTGQRTGRVITLDIEQSVE